MFWRLPFEGAAESWPPMAPAAHDDFPELRARFEDLDATVVPAFTAHDRAALMAQRHHRCYQLALIVGAALTGFAGALQAAINDTAWSGGSRDGPGTRHDSHRRSATPQPADVDVSHRTGEGRRASLALFPISVGNDDVGHPRSRSRSRDDRAP